MWILEVPCYIFWDLLGVNQKLVNLGPEEDRTRINAQTQAYEIQNKCLIGF